MGLPPDGKDLIEATLVHFLEAGLDFFIAFRENERQRHFLCCLRTRWSEMANSFAWRQPSTVQIVFAKMFPYRVGFGCRFSILFCSDKASLVVVFLCLDLWPLLIVNCSCVKVYRPRHQSYKNFLSHDVFLSVFF